ncbi:hypothetical protein, partial [Vibrio parahaemolyticus]|uniref:hypothetical protein n=1 Tax=Vibrio parahaemolyticus TaxID=670 RepID=UPI001C608C4B
MFITLILFLLSVVLTPKLGFFVPSISIGVDIFDIVSIPLLLFLTSVSTFIIYLNNKRSYKNSV